MNLMVVADDDISPEELQQALQYASNSRKRHLIQSEERSFSDGKKSKQSRNSCKLKRKKELSLFGTSKHSSVREAPYSNDANESDFVQEEVSPLLTPSEIRSGIFKRITRNGCDVNSDTEEDGDIACSDERIKCKTLSKKCYSEDLKQRLKKNACEFSHNGNNSSSGSTNGQEKVSGVKNGFLQIVQNGVKSNEDGSFYSDEKHAKVVQEGKGVSKYGSTSTQCLNFKAVNDHETSNGNTKGGCNSFAVDDQVESDDFSITKISPQLFDNPRQEKPADYFAQLSDSIPDHAYVALDCEMVGVGLKGRISVLGRCSVLDYEGHIIYDKFIRPAEVITDFRTRWSGIRPKNMVNAVPIDTALREIQACLKHKIIIGHAVYNDFKVLSHQISNHMVRDTASCKLLTEWAGLASCTNGLKKLSAAVLGRAIQVGKRGHCSVEDARASLDLFKLARRQWEPELLKCWDKKGVDVAATVKQLAESASHRRDSVGEDFLEDKFWPNYVTH